MDTMQAIIQAISTLGFPIVMCAALFWKMDKQDKEHKLETDKLSTALANNTIALEKILQKISGDTK